MVAESIRLDGLIGALLGSHEEKKLSSRLALARAAGKPYDRDRLELFDVLHGALAGEMFVHPPDPASSGTARIHDWTSRFNFGQALHDIEASLRRCNAFQEELRAYRLTFPESP